MLKLIQGYNRRTAHATEDALDVQDDLKVALTQVVSAVEAQTKEIEGLRTDMKAMVA